LPIPFVNLGDGEHSGVAGYLRFTDEPDGKGVRGALFIMSTRGEPLGFSFTRTDFRPGVLWRLGDARRQAVSSLTKALFEAADRVPDVVFTLAEEMPARVFSEDMAVQVPVCRVAASDLGPVAQSEQVQRISDSIVLIWVNEPPAPGAAAGKTVDLLDSRQFLLEPFERASLGLQEAYEA
jgi:hypothetical protein